MGSGLQRQYPDRMLVMVDSKGDFEEYFVGMIRSCCAAKEKNNFEYTISINDSNVICAEQQYVKPLRIPEFHWISSRRRDVAIRLETHGDIHFEAVILRKDKEGLFEVEFKADKSILDGVVSDHMLEPHEGSVKDQSPESTAPNPLWLLDRKMQAFIDQYILMSKRIIDCLDTLKEPRGPFTPPLRGPFTGREQQDSEGYPSHPCPMPELKIDADFVNAWSKVAGKVKFAGSFKMGPDYPRFDHWLDIADAGDPLYFYAALPVYAGLICLGTFSLGDFKNEPEFIKANDVALLGVALYVNGELQTVMPNPPLVANAMEKLGHEACNFIPGCTSTYQVDCTWVGGVFCLAPSDSDMEVADDINNIETYHAILKEWSKRLAREGNANGSIKIEVDIVISTDYLANIRQVCCGEIEVVLSERGLAAAAKRLHDVKTNKVNSREAQFPKRPSKGVLSALTAAERLEIKKQEAAKAEAHGRRGSKNLALPAPSPAGSAGLLPAGRSPAATPQGGRIRTYTADTAASVASSNKAPSPTNKDAGPPPTGSSSGYGPPGATTGLVSPRPPASPGPRPTVPGQLP
eukprot:gnl/MRDRNA2_/MRDRNA2_112703_c0_seq1.p1 gnl/MRDRNA2_/MRDRNA2_112703_c0~~gnl/MRDRNA2_/MRDRNA2_112703_c0_seq1.p1  ORF type:complete len:576 (+),score=119.25 gnl/MRDRNA2_/MRDRNA2_112703_c0_seq1:108-1835(+)